MTTYKLCSEEVTECESIEETVSIYIYIYVFTSLQIVILFQRARIYSYIGFVKVRDVLIKLSVQSLVCCASNVRFSVLAPS